MRETDRLKPKETDENREYIQLGENLHLMGNTHRKHGLIYCIYYQLLDSRARHSISDTHTHTHKYTHAWSHTHGSCRQCRGDIHTHTLRSTLMQVHTNTPPQTPAEGTFM